MEQAEYKMGRIWNGQKIRCSETEMGKKMECAENRMCRKQNVQKTERAKNRILLLSQECVKNGMCSKWNMQKTECAENRMCKKQNVINQECVKNGMKIYYLICDTVIFGMQKEFNARHDDKEVFYQISFYPQRNANL